LEVGSRIRVFDHEFPGQSGHAISESGMLVENVTRKALQASQFAVAGDTASA
jgi:hypothetical protein